MRLAPALVLAPVLLFGLAVAPRVAPTCADDEASPAVDESVPPELRARIDELIGRLGSRVWRERESATAGLIEIGRHAHPALRRAASSRDPEVRWRVRIVLRAAEQRVHRLVREAIARDLAPSWPFGPAPFEGIRRDDIAASAHGGPTGAAHGAIARELGRRIRSLVAEDWDVIDPLLSDIEKQASLATVLAAQSDEEGLRRCRLAVQIDAWLLSIVASAEHGARIATALCEVPVDEHADLEDLVADLPGVGAGEALRAIAKDRGSGTGPRARAVRLLTLRVASGLESPADAVPAIIAGLSATDATVRAAGVEGVLELARPPGGPVGEALTRAIDREAPGALRDRLIEVAGHLAEPAVSAALLPIVTDPSGRVSSRAIAARALGTMLPPDAAAVADLVRIVGDAAEPQDVRTAAAVALGLVGAPSAVPVLVAQLDEPFVGREELLTALGRIGTVEAVGALAEIAASRRGERAIEATHALGEVRRAHGPAAEILRKLLELSGDGNLLAATIEACGRHGDPHALGAIRTRFLDEGEGITEVRKAAIAAIARAGDRRAIPSLVKVASHRATDAELRSEAISALGSLGDPAAMGPLRALIKSTRARDKLRAEAAQALARCGDPSGTAEAIRKSEAAFIQNPLSSFNLNTLGIDYLYARSAPRAVATFRRMLRGSASDNVALYNVACTFSVTGDTIRGMRYLWRSVRAGFRDPDYMGIDADMHPLRPERRFHVLLRELGAEIPPTEVERAAAEKR